jgi:hypothetical protein
MVQIVVKKPKIYRGDTPADEFKAELTEMMKDAAIKFKCDVHQLKCRFANNGVVEIAKMDADEISEMEKKRIAKKNVKKIREQRGLN